MIIFLSINVYMCFWCSKEPSHRLIETVLLSTRNTCFGLEIRKLIFNCALLSGSLLSSQLTESGYSKTFVTKIMKDVIYEFLKTFIKSQ